MTNAFTAKPDTKAFLKASNRDEKKRVAAAAGLKRMTPEQYRTLYAPVAGGDPLPPQKPENKK